MYRRNKASHRSNAWTQFCLQSRHSCLYSWLPKSLDHLLEFQQIRNSKQGSPGTQVDYRIFGDDIGPSGWHRHQVLTFVAKVRSVLSPGVQIGDEFKLPARPRMERVRDFETSRRTVRIGRS